MNIIIVALIFFVAGLSLGAVLTSIDDGKISIIWLIYLIVSLMIGISDIIISNYK